MSVNHGDLVLIWNRGRAETSDLADRLVQVLTAKGALEYGAEGGASTVTTPPS